MQNKKICIFLPYHKYEGGAERVAVRIGDGLEKKGYEIYYLTLYKGDFMKPNELCLQYRENILSKTLGIFTSAYKLNKYVERHNIDVVISHLPRLNHANALVKLFGIKKIKYIAVAHNSDHNGVLNILGMRLLWVFIDKVVCVSKGVEQAVQKIGVKNTCTVYNPFNLEIIEQQGQGALESKDAELFNTHENSTVVLQIARFVDQKNHFLGMRAFIQAHKKNPRLRLFLLGSGPHELEIKKMVQEHNLSDSVFFLGTRTNVFPLIKRSDYVLLSSNHEGLPTVLVESLLSGTPCISTDCHSGPREIIFSEYTLQQSVDFPCSNENGFLVEDPRKDSVKAEQNLVSVLSGLGQKTKPVVYKDVDLYSEISVMEQWEALLT